MRIGSGAGLQGLRIQTKGMCKLYNGEGCSAQRT